MSLLPGVSLARARFAADATSVACTQRERGAVTKVTEGGKSLLGRLVESGTTLGSVRIK